MCPVKGQIALHLNAYSPAFGMHRRPRIRMPAIKDLYCQKFIPAGNLLRMEDYSL